MSLPDDALLAAMRAAFAPEIGDAPRGRVSERYDVREEIAQGGMGVVWRGFDLELSREVAIKTLQHGLDAHDAIVLRFANEARITGRLQHPGIVPVYEHARLPDGRPFLTMKLIGGETLHDILARPGATNDRRRLLAIFEQVVQTIGYAHSEGIVHRDLKPANVMVGAFGEVQVVDWGLAVDLRGEGTAERGVVGTKGYMAPEQERGESVDARADVFALGTILRELVGERPDPELLALIAACRASDEGLRPRDASELAQRLNGYLSAFDARARRAEERRRARPLRLSLAAAVVLVAALATLGGVRLVNERNARADGEFMKTLEEFRAQLGHINDPADFQREDARFTQVLRVRAVDLDSVGDPAAIAALRADRLAAEIADVLYRWAILRKQNGRDDRDCSHLVRIANAIDPDASERSVRAAIYETDLQGLRELAAATAPRQLSPLTWTLLATRIQSFGDADTALPVLERAWEEYSGDFWLSLHLGHAHQHCAPPHKSEALRFFTVLVALRPDSWLAHSYLASAWVDHGHLDAAEAEYRRAIALRPVLGKEHLNLSFVLRNKGDIPGAIAACKKALELEPTLAPAWIDLATMLHSIGDRRGSLESLRRVLALRNEDPHAHYNVGVYMLEDGRLDEASAEFREALRLEPKHPRAATQLGRCLLTQGQPGPALEYLTKGRELAATESDRASHDKQIAECKRLLALESLSESERDPRALVELARLELTRKNGTRALALFESAFARDGTLCDDMKAGVRYAAARAAALCGERAKALEWLRQDLDRWDQLLTAGTPAARRTARTVLAKWQEDPDLAGLRSDEIWARVAAVLERASR